MIRTEGRWFKDEHGRTLILRGVNLGGSSKVPSLRTGPPITGKASSTTAQVSFVGRPFPLAEADEHFGRLAEWGQTFLRFLVTWEAVEHAGPGLYDEEYLDYLLRGGEAKPASTASTCSSTRTRICGAASRAATAPPAGRSRRLAWTSPASAETGAAIVHQVHGDPLPRMIWPTNGGKLAAATLFTLFFAGSDLAPHTWWRASRCRSTCSAITWQPCSRWPCA